MIVSLTSVASNSKAKPAWERITWLLVLSTATPLANSILVRLACVSVVASDGTEALTYGRDATKTSAIAAVAVISIFCFFFRVNISVFHLRGYFNVYLFGQVFKKEAALLMCTKGEP